MWSFVAVVRGNAIATGRHDARELLAKGDPRRTGPIEGPGFG
jgi:hypothetical protein